LDCSRCHVVVRDGIDETGASHQDRLGKELANARKGFEKRERVGFRHGSESMAIKLAIERRARRRMEALDLHR
jgi:putative hemolysin